MSLSTDGRARALKRWLAQGLDLAGDIGRATDDRALAQRNAFTAFLVRVASAGILYFVQVILARWMGAGEYGIYVFVWTWVLVLSCVSQLGFATVMMRLVPEYMERGEHGLLRGLLLGGRALAFLAGTLIAAAGMLLLWLVGDQLTSHFVLPLFLALACVPLCAVSDVQDGIGRGRGWMAVGLVPPYILRPLLLLGCMGAAYAWGLPVSAVTAAAAAVLATWLAALLQMAVIAWRFRGDTPALARRTDYQRWLRTALPLLLIALSEVVLQNADVLTLSAVVTPADVAMYFAAAKTMGLVLFIHYAVGSAVANQLSVLNVRGDRAGLEARVRDAIHWTFWPTLAGSFAVLALGRPLLWLFDPQFTEAYPVMFVLAVGFIVRASMGPAEFVLNMLGEQKLCAAVLGIVAVLDIGLCALLIPRFGMMGAAVATSLALGTASLLNYVVARHRLGLDMSIWNATRRR